jgi:hypothetical protein
LRGSIFTPNPYRPFPPGIRADRDGSYFQWDLGRAYRFAILTAISFLDERTRDLIDRTGTSIAEWYPEIAVLGRAPRDHTMWLYKLEIFTVDKQFASDSVSLADHAHDFRALVFDSFDDLERKCAEELGIRLEDLVLRAETNYPSN